MKLLRNRMKNYENNEDYTLTNYLPIVIRIDGKNFSKFTKGMEKPFDDILIKTMQDTTIELCQNIQNAKIGYTQSDEISILSFQSNIESKPFLKNRVQKIASITSSMATLYFNEIYQNIVKNIDDEIYQNKINKALFDSRVFALPKNEVNNYFVWRQKDAEKNSKSCICQSLYSQKELMNKKQNEQMDMMFNKGINWNDVETTKKRGSCVIKQKIKHNGVKRNKWMVDEDIPIFSKDEDYINKYINI